MQWNDVTDSDNPVPRPLRFTFAIFAITLSRLLYGYDRGAIGGASLGWYKHGILTNSQYSVCTIPGPMFHNLGNDVTLFLCRVLSFSN